MRILVVGDEKDLNAIISKKLTIEGYSVDCCFDGEESLSYLNVIEYDAVILDIMMPKINGLEVIQYLHNRIIQHQYYY